VADDGEAVYQFESTDTSTKSKASKTQKIKATEEVPASLLRKDLFGMGYPYFICSYGDKIAVSTDFGIVVL
jgi:hypothetical protein